METDEARPTPDPALAATLAASDVLRRIAGTAAIHLYELRYGEDGSYECTAFIGEGLASLLGSLPEGVDEEAAWEEAVHPDDRAAYDAFTEACRTGEASEIEFRLVGFDGVTRWVWERARPRVENGIVWVDGVVYAGGHYSTYCGPVPGNNFFCAGRPGSAARSKLAAFDETTGALETWAPTVNTALGIEAVGADLGRVAVGGEFTRISGVNVNHFARFQE